MNEFKTMIGDVRFWAVILLLVVAGLSLGGCTKQQMVGVKLPSIAPDASQMVAPEELPNRSPSNTDIKDVTRAWANDRRIGGQCIATLKDLQAHIRTTSKEPKKK